MFDDKADGGIQFLRMQQCHKRQNCGKRRSHKHELYHGEILMPLKHATLELACKAVKKQKEDQQHNARPSGPNFSTPNIESKAQVVCRGHKHGDPDTNHECHCVVVLGVGFVAQDFSHGHDGGQLEGFENGRGWK